MGLFSSLGRKTERVKQAVTGETKQQCLSCEEVLPENAEACPHCGDEAVIPAE